MPGIGIVGIYIPGIMPGIGIIPRPCGPNPGGIIGARIPMRIACLRYLSYCLLMYFWIRIGWSSTCFLFMVCIALLTLSGDTKLIKQLPVPLFWIYSSPDSSKYRFCK